ncbi:PrgI family protein [Kocuria varians]
MSSSAVLAVVIVLSVMWFAPHVVRRTSMPVHAQVEAPDLQIGSALHNHERSAPAPSRVVTTTAPAQVHERETTAMETSAHAPSAITLQRGSLAGLRIKWDRTIVFLTGAVLVAAALISALLAPFTSISWAVPVVLLLLGAGCVAGLRYLAVEDRRQRAARSTSRSVAPAQHAIFDNEDEVRQDRDQENRVAEAALDMPAAEEQPREEQQTPQRAPERVYTVAELRAEAMKVARSTGADTTTWEPVPVPKPLYTQAPVVQRSEPEPLQVPARPAARTTTLKDAVRTGEQESTALNLDDVLKRRRA